MFQSLTLPQNPTILESGTGQGRSTWAFLELWPDAHVFTCDPDREHNFQDKRITFFRMQTVKLKWHKLIDLFFIDNSHTYENVKEDFEKFFKFVKKGGYIVFHDYHEDGGDVSGIRDFVKQLDPAKVKLFTSGEFGGAVYTK